MSDPDIDELFQLLGQRQYGISHVAMPSFEQHREFVLSHPYRAWMFVEHEGETVGSLYLLESNHIGINMKSGYAWCIETAIHLLCKQYEPLPAIASVRSGKYAINVAPEDNEQVRALQDAGAMLIQHTFQIP
ncbi:MAG: hypothetical protein AB8B64_16060 [Granulosicoccus sp.]